MRKGVQDLGSVSLLCGAPFWLPAYMGVIPFIGSHSHPGCFQLSMHCSSSLWRAFAPQ